jgi:glycosyltransferase involved in cell wall biosynthesis
MQTPLRILLIVDLPWDARLGASRVFMELAKAWQAQGHTVSKYCLSDAYPAGMISGFLSTWRQLFFPRKAAAFVRRNRNQFDVVDALIGTLPFPKQRLQFSGLVVARSVGFYRLYQDFEQFARNRWPDQPRGKFLGRVFYALVRKRMFQASENALRHCDLVNFPNEEELRYLRERIGSNKAAIVQPYGLTAERRQSFRQTAAPGSQRLTKRKISSIGTWDPRKGAKDWAEIIRRVRASISDARFVFLGTLTDDRKIRQDLGLPNDEFVELVREYQPDDLPKLLADSTAGAFPSYAEGFGFGLLEQLAAGIPTVAYDAPGPRSILQNALPDLLVSIGNAEKFAEALVRILRCDLSTYEKLATQSLETASRFDWSTIAQETARSYQAHLIHDQH